MINLKENEGNKWITAIGIILPVVVAILYYFPKSGEAGAFVKSIPAFNALLNGATFLVITAALVAIKSGKRILHRNLMASAVLMSVLFLIGYVVYHASVESTKFGGEGDIRYIYFFILITHIILAAALAPLVLLTLFRAIKQDFEKHKKIARWTYPIWLYVSITGIVVYLMISPYYA